MTHVRFNVDDPGLANGLGSLNSLHILSDCNAKGLRVVEMMINMEMIPLIAKCLQPSVSNFLDELDHYRRSHWLTNSHATTNQKHVRL